MAEISAKTILTKTGSREWFGTDYTMNIYRGCHHGCIYCDSRSECYQIEQFDQVDYKHLALELLNTELQGKRVKAVLGFGAMSDAYNHLEKKKELTRGALKLANIHGFGISLATKSCLISRDIDLYKAIQKHSPVNLGFSFSTEDDTLGRKIERNVSLPSERFKTLKQLRENGVYCGILLMPILPHITDDWGMLERLILKAEQNGASYIYPLFGMTLRDRQKEHYYQFLNQLFPNELKMYQREDRNQYYFAAEKEQQLAYNFKNLCTKLGIAYEMGEIIDNYQSSYSPKQETLF